MMSNLLFSGTEWTFDLLERTWAAIDKIGKEEFNLSYYPPSLEVISSDQMLEAYSSVAMPIMYNHWSFGKSFIQNDAAYKKGRQGLAYEVVINTNPTIAYLMENNSMTMQTLVMAHAVCGHGSFFKNNYMFKEYTDADFIIDYLKFARDYIDECEQKYGAREVELLLDACHALQYYGVDRYKRQKSNIEVDHMAYDQEMFDSVWHKLGINTEYSKPSEQLYYTKDRTFPEENILYFLEKKSPVLEGWQREVIRIVRTIAKYFYPQMQTQLMNEGWACYKGDTEFLSQNGWKRFSEYSKGDLVAQYAEDGTITFVDPIEYVQYENADLLEIKSEGVNQCVTPNHRMIYHSRRGNLNECRADELNIGISRTFITCGKLKTSTKLNMTDAEIKLMVAVIADGSFRQRDNSTYCQMGFIKQRKIDRVKLLLEEASIPYTESKWSQGRVGISFNAPVRCKSYASWYKASTEQLQIICEEALFWDGNVKRQVYYSTDKDNMDFIQYALAMTGRRGMLTVRPSKGNSKALYVVTNVQCTKPTLSGGSITPQNPDTVYCFKVPTGMLVTRRENVINISGNTFVHYNIMNSMWNKGLINEGSYLEFIESHTSVVYQPDYDDQRFSGINVYALGFAMMQDLKRICINPTKEDLIYCPDIANTNWKETLKGIVANYRDESFVMQYLTPKVIRDFKLFLFSDKQSEDKYTITGIHGDDDVYDIREALSKQYNLGYKLPQIQIVSCDFKESRRLVLEHLPVNNQKLDDKTSRKVLEYIHYLWGHEVELLEK